MLLLPPEELHLFQIPVKVISLHCQQPPPGLGTAASAMINSSSISPGAAAAFPLQPRGPSPSRSSPPMLCSSSQPPRTAPSFLCTSTQPPHSCPFCLTSASAPGPLKLLFLPQSLLTPSLFHVHPQPHAFARCPPQCQSLYLPSRSPSPPARPPHPSRSVCSLWFSPHPLVAASCCSLLAPGTLAVFLPGQLSLAELSLTRMALGTLQAPPALHPCLIPQGHPAWHARCRAALSSSLACMSCPAVSHLTL